MIPVETTEPALLENYVLVSGMDDFGWDEGDWEPDDWTNCEYCGGPPPPPMFNLPPPPRPPSALPDEFGVLHDFEDLYNDCEAYQWTCPAYHGAREDPRPSTEQFPIAVIIVTAATLVAVILVAAIIIFKVKRGGRSSKNCNQLGGAHIYDDLPTVNNRVRNHLNNQFKPITRDSGHGLPMGLHLYTPEPHSRPESEHLYQSISSGSETCSYSTGDAALPSGSHRPSPICHGYSEARMAPSTLNAYCQAQPSLLPHNRLCFEAHSILNAENSADFNAALMSGRDASNSPPCLSPCHSPNHMHQMAQSHSTRHIPCQALHQLAEVTHCHTTRHTSYHSPQHTPCHTPQHTPCHSPQHAENPSPCSSTKYEEPSYFSIPSGVVKSPSTGSSVYYVSGCNNTNNGRPITPQERGLPPLPSRSDRYRNYFSTDRNTRNAPGRPCSPPAAPPRIEPDVIARRLHPDVLGHSEKNININRNVQNSLHSHNPLGLPPSYGADSSLPLSCEKALPPSYGADSSLPPTCDRESALSSFNSRNNVVCTPSGVRNDQKNPKIEEEPLYENMP